MGVTPNTNITDDTARKHIWYCDIDTNQLVDKKSVSELSRKTLIGSRPI